MIIINQAVLASIWGTIMDHQTVSALIAAWLGSNVVSALPSPNSTSGNFYKFIFSLSHGLAGSLPRLLPMLRMPGDTSRDSTPFYTPPQSPANAAGVANNALGVPQDPLKPPIN